MRILAGSGLSDVLESKHHQLKQSKGSLNLSKNISLTEPFDRYGCSFKKNKRLHNIVNGQVFPECIYKDFLCLFENFFR